MDNHGSSGIILDYNGLSMDWVKGFCLHESPLFDGGNHGFLRRCSTMVSCKLIQRTGKSPSSSSANQLNRWAIFNRYVELPEGRSTKLRIYRPTPNSAVGQGTWDAKRVPLIQHKKANVPIDLVPSGNKHRHGPRNSLNWFEGNSTRNLCSKPSNTSSPSIDKSSSSQRHTCNMGDMGFHNVNASRLSCLYVPKTARIPWDTSLILSPQLSKTILTPASVIGMIEPN